MRRDGVREGGMTRRSSGGGYRREKQRKSDK